MAATDREIVEAARRGEGIVRDPNPWSPWRVPLPPPREEAEDRLIFITQRPALLADLLTFKCAVRPVGGEIEIRCRTRAETERLLAFLKNRRIHGLVRKDRGR